MECARIAKSHILTLGCAGANHERNDCEKNQGSFHASLDVIMAIPAEN
jgi:hypothetical protein